MKEPLRPVVDVDDVIYSPALENEQAFNDILVPAPQDRAVVRMYLKPSMQEVKGKRVLIHGDHFYRFRMPAPAEKQEVQCYFVTELERGH